MPLSKLEIMMTVGLSKCIFSMKKLDLSLTDVFMCVFVFTKCESFIPDVYVCLFVSVIHHFALVCCILCHLQFHLLMFGVNGQTGVSSSTVTKFAINCPYFYSI